VSGTPDIDLGTYCRHIEAYLCRRNGGHLVRIVGPAFERVGAWAALGVPLSIVFRGIDRFVERHRGRPRRRPARIEFCEADVLDAFDEWKRAVGRLAGGALTGFTGAAEDAAAEGDARVPSLPAHIARVQARLTSLLASQRWADRVRAQIETILQELDGLQGPARTARGESRKTMLARLQTRDRDLVEAAWETQDPASCAALLEEARGELAAFRGRMNETAWQSAAEAAARRLLRERLGLPAVALE
jgi:hypothetical protein